MTKQLVHSHRNCSRDISRQSPCVYDMPICHHHPIQIRPQQSMVDVRMIAMRIWQVLVTLSPKGPTLSRQGFAQAVYSLYQRYEGRLLQAHAPSAADTHILCAAVPHFVASFAAPVICMLSHPKHSLHLQQPVQYACMRLNAAMQDMTSDADHRAH